ncbi:ABC transporter permease [Frigoribacterium sp. PhB24]|uniref:ABC transporter permease n=1 Tax=Frigoribacterium sp. PhB24 TaxID=2485204 RepID=UPI000F47FBB6|nr:ABC transporter permease [Frigoribacterium sp. PhB24]ROS48863.1 monosaccharide ABC transporter membrane protein (CUT2 family) [Frigoribacterium sp. PhB24]
MTDLTTASTRRGIDWAVVGRWAKEQYPLYILVVLLVVAGLSTDAFFTTRNLTNLVLQTSVIGIVTLAQFIIVITGGIDISVGSVVGLSGVLAAGLFGGTSVGVAILVAVCVGALIGTVNGYLVAFRGLEPFIVTLGMLALARGLVYAFTEGSPVRPEAADFRAIATSTVLGFPVIGLIWLGLAVVLAFVTRSTVFGRRIYALGSSKEAAHASGVPVRTTLVAVYALAGVLVGFAGFLLASRVGAGTPTAGNLYELDSIAAVVIGGAALAGGKGRVFGAVVGTLIFGVITNLLVLLNVSTFLQDAFRGGLILLAVILTTFRFATKRTGVGPT